MTYLQLETFCQYLQLEYTHEQIDFFQAFKFTHEGVLYIFGKSLDQKYYQCTNQDNEKIKDTIYECLNDDWDDSNTISNQEAFASHNY